MNHLFLASIPTFYFVLPVVLTVVILIIFFNDKSRTLRKIRKTPFIKIADFEEGKTGKIIGEIHSIGEDLVAPISLRKCVGYEVEVTQSNGDDGSTTILSVKKINDAVITRDGANAMILAENVEFVVNDSSNIKTGWPNKTSFHIQTFLEDNGISTKNLLGIQKSYTITEGTFHVGETVAAVGKGNWTTKSKLGSREETVKYLELTPTATDPVYISDSSNTFTR